MKTAALLPLFSFTLQLQNRNNLRISNIDIANIAKSIPECSFWPLMVAINMLLSQDTFIHHTAQILIDSF